MPFVVIAIAALDAGDLCAGRLALDHAPARSEGVAALTPGARVHHDLAEVPAALLMAIGGLGVREGEHAVDRRLEPCSAMALFMSANMSREPT